MWYVLASSPVDFERFDRERRADRMPRHLLPVIAERFDATLAMPDPARVTRRDRRLSRIYGLPHHWELARRLIKEVDHGDVVFTTGDDSGVPLALLCALRRRRVAFAIGITDPSRPKIKMLGWLLSLLLDRLLILVTLEEHAERVGRSFGRLASNVSTIGYTTDLEFFRPDDGRTDNDPPVIAGSGTEQRDYATLGAAIAPLDVVGRISFVSPNFSSKTRYTLPEPVGPNIEFRHYDFDELRSLYQRADAMVIPLLENRYSAGLTAMFEAIACGCPVIITESPGIIQGLIDDDLVVGVPGGSPDALRAAITAIVTDPTAARERAQRAYDHLVEHHSTAHFLGRLNGLLAELIADPAPLKPDPPTPISGDEGNGAGPEAAIG